ncbi:hypothetical protein [Massilia varians]|uniref:hypothetical protein n=1 Tax=Massilia varians TaxID=457921 RepID=UPI002556952D|nr:hypothetical protein [Massilia varians]MDK6079659.1 hypothetical protein [Massilia varians]
MNKRFTPVISATVLVTVKGSTKDAAGLPVPFKFSLTCTRLPASVLKERIQGGEFDVKDVMKEVTTDWKGQRLITDQETGQPAEFCPEAFEAMLDISGMALLCFNAYAKESSANEKN